MELAMEEMPLALFTTLAPVGAGAFLALWAAFAKGGLDEAAEKRLDRLTVVPLLFLVAGFAAAFVHLANPMHAAGALAGLGRSPLSNEVCAGVVFTLLALVYWVCAVAGKLAGGARKGFLALLAVLALVFALFTGMAYWVDTISTWATPALLLEMLGVCLAGGTVLGELIVAAARDGEAGALDEKAAHAMAWALGAGFGLLLVGAVWQFALAANTATPYVSGAEAAQGMAVLLVAGLALAAVGYALASKGLKKPAVGGLVAALVCMGAGVFMLRLVFYGLRISVGV